jgi:hypothetical protein
MAHQWLVDMPVDRNFHSGKSVLCGPVSRDSAIYDQRRSKCLSDFRRHSSIGYSIRKNALCGSYVIRCGHISSTCRYGKPY